MELTSSLLKVDPLQLDPWSPEANPAVVELLDHLAQELAQEYLRLMEMAAESEKTDRDLRREA